MPAPRKASPSARKAKAADDAGADGAAEDGADSARKPKKVVAKKKKSVDAEGGDAGAGESQKEMDRVRVFLKIGSETGSSVSSCVTCDPKNKTAWALDFDGQRTEQDQGRRRALTSADAKEVAR